MTEIKLDQKDSSGNLSNYIQFSIFLTSGFFLKEMFLYKKLKGGSSTKLLLN